MPCLYEGVFASQKTTFKRYMRTKSSVMMRYLRLKVEYQRVSTGLTCSTNVVMARMTTPLI